LAAGLSLIWRIRSGDIVVAKTDPPMLSVLVAPIAWLKGVRSINWLQDIFPEVAAALTIGQGPVQKWVLSILRRIRNETLRKATVNVALGEQMARKLREFGVPENRIRIIPNWADGHLIRPLCSRHNALRKEWGIQDAFVIGYSGNLGRAHEIETFLAAITTLEEQVLTQAKAFACALPANVSLRHAPEQDCPCLSKVRWLFIGGGVRMKELKRQVEARGLKSVIFRPYQPRERLPESLSLPDVHLISLRSELEGLIVPSKYYGIAAAGRPAIFVGHLEGEIARTIKRTQTGFVVRERDGAGLVRAILALANNPELAAKQGERARQLFEAEFDFPVAASAWSNLIEEVVRTRHKAGSPLIRPLQEKAAK
jgi:colanic acid biosynthesis glycosyl transferase WcaI